MHVAGKDTYMKYSGRVLDSKYIRTMRTIAQNQEIQTKKKEKYLEMCLKQQATPRWGGESITSNLPGEAG